MNIAYQNNCDSPTNKTPHWLHPVHHLTIKYWVCTVTRCHCDHACLGKRLAICDGCLTAWVYSLAVYSICNCIDLRQILILGSLVRGQCNCMYLLEIYNILLLPFEIGSKVVQTKPATEMIIWVWVTNNYANTCYAMNLSLIHILQKPYK